MTPSRQNSSWQQKQCFYKLKHPINGKTKNSKRQGDQPNQWKKKQNDQSEWPAQN